MLDIEDIAREALSLPPEDWTFIAAGMLVGPARWLLIDSFHHRTDVPKPA